MDLFVVCLFEIRLLYTQPTRESAQVTRIHRDLCEDRRKCTKTSRKQCWLHFHQYWGILSHGQRRVGSRKRPIEY